MFDTNQVAYLIYFSGLIGIALLLELLRRLGRLAAAGEATRGPTSMGIVHGTFVVITVINIGIAQIIVPLLGQTITRFAFLMMVLETVAWAYVIYWNGWSRNKIIGIVNAAATDRR